MGKLDKFMKLTSVSLILMILKEYLLKNEAFFNLNREN